LERHDSGFDRPTDAEVTSLRFASKSRHDGVVVMLFRAGATVDARVRQLPTSLWLAARHDNLDVVKM
jgi:ankyrin repeat protein